MLKFHEKDTISHYFKISSNSHIVFVPRFFLRDVLRDALRKDQASSNACQDYYVLTNADKSEKFRRTLPEECSRTSWPPKERASSTPAAAGAALRRGAPRRGPRGPLHGARRGPRHHKKLLFPRPLACAPTKSTGFTDVDRRW